MPPYYSTHAQEYIDSTIDIDMTYNHELFLSHFSGGVILDVGFGSGRDMLYFRSKGYEVEGIDPEQAFVDHALSLGLHVIKADALSYRPDKAYDGIWANASLLHLPREKMKQAIERLKGMLSDKGILFISLKKGIGESIDALGRPMTYVSEEELMELGLEILSISPDALGRDVKWINAIYRR